MRAVAWKRDESMAEAFPRRRRSPLVRRPRSGAFAGVARGDRPASSQHDCRRRERNRSIRACNREAWRSRDRARRTCRRARWTIRKRHELRGAARPRSRRDRARLIRRTDGALPSRTTRSYEFAEAPERVKMLIDAPIAGTHRVELDAGHPHLTERVDAPYPVLRAVLRGEKSSFNRKARWIASFLAHQSTKYIHSHSTVLVRWEVREPAVGDLRDAPQRGLGDRPLLPVPAAAHPDRYGPLHG